MFTTWKEEKLSLEAVQNFKLECFKDCSCEGLGLRDRKALGVYDNNNDNSYNDNDNYWRDRCKGKKCVYIIKITKLLIMMSIYMEIIL